MKFCILMRKVFSKLTFKYIIINRESNALTVSIIMLNGGTDMKKSGIFALALTGIFAASAAFGASQFVMGTGGVSGTYYPLGGALSQIITDHSDGKINCVGQATGASIENLNLVNAGEIDLAIVQNDTADYAKNGTMFFKAPLKNITVICRLYPEHIQVAANEGSGITKIEDFKGKRFSIGAPGSGVEANARQILGEVGMFDGTKFVGFDPHYLSFSESTSHFKDRLIDGFIFTTGAPNSGIQEIVTTQPLQFIEIKGEFRDKLIAKYPFFAKEIIPAGTYKGQDKDVETIAVQACLIARRDMSDDDAYAVTKAIFENLDLISQAHAKGKNIQLKTALDGMTLDVHPGALKYYKEVGLVK